VIDDLDRTLETLLEQGLPPGLAAQVAITFAAPDEQFPPASVTPPAIDFFLYDVRENAELRASEWMLERRDDGTASREPPPPRVDCSYLVTAWPSETSTTPALDEHRLLGAVMTVLLRHSTIPEAALQGVLADQELPLPLTRLQAGRLQSLGEFWQALGGKPKAALDLTVTVAVRAVPPVEAGPPVLEKRLRFLHGVRRED
jgi:hypothetical protein